MKNKHCLCYDTPEGDEGRQSGQVATRPTIQDVELPTKQAKKSHAEAVASSSTARVIQPVPPVDWAIMFICFQFFWPSSPTDCSVQLISSSTPPVCIHLYEDTKAWHLSP